MHIVLLCATRRGYLFAQKVMQFVPESRFTVFSFKEETWEPPFVEDIRALTLANDGQFFLARQVGDARWEAFWENTHVDLMLIVSWRYVIPPSVYTRPKIGTFVFHDSLLPKYRGFSPTVWAMINGEDHTGVTLFQISEEADMGDIVAQRAVPICPDDTIACVMERVTQAYLDLVEGHLEALLARTFRLTSQDHSAATYTCKRLPEDNLIDWAAPSTAIYNLVRAVTRPYTGAYAYLDGKRIHVWSARRVVGTYKYVGAVPGRVVEVRPGEGSVVLTGDGPLLITEVQAEGGNFVCATDVLNKLSQTLRSVPVS